MIIRWIRPGLATVQVHGPPNKRNQGPQVNALEWMAVSFCVSLSVCMSCTSQVSLTVHRVGSTLMVDDATPVAMAMANIHRKRANKGTPPGFFFKGSGPKSAPPGFPIPTANRLQERQQQEQLEAKLLYHSFSLEAGLQRQEAGQRSNYVTSFAFAPP